MLSSESSTHRFEFPVLSAIAHKQPTRQQDKEATRQQGNNKAIKQKDKRKNKLGIGRNINTCNDHNTRNMSLSFLLEDTIVDQPWNTYQTICVVEKRAQPTALKRCSETINVGVLTIQCSEISILSSISFFQSFGFIALNSIV